MILRRAPKLTQIGKLLGMILKLLSMKIVLLSRLIGNIRYMETVFMAMQLPALSSEFSTG